MRISDWSSDVCSSDLVVILVYNSLSAMVLAIYSPDGQVGPKEILLSILRNPLIIGVVAAVPFAYWQIDLPGWLMTSGQYFAQLTLPLALICIGAPLSLDSLRQDSSVGRCLGEEGAGRCRIR